jgi:hypothetical protein
MSRASAFAALLVPMLLGAAVAVAQPGTARQVDDKATKADYELDASGTAKDIGSGKEGAFVLVVRPKGDKKIHPQAPFEVTFRPSPGLKPAKGKLNRSDVTDKAAKAPEVKTQLKGTAKGAQTIEADVSFFICTDAWCQRMTDRVSVNVNVTE